MSNLEPETTYSERFEALVNRIMPPVLKAPSSNPEDQYLRRTAAEVRAAIEHAASVGIVRELMGTRDFRAIEGPLRKAADAVSQIQLDFPRRADLKLGETCRDVDNFASNEADRLKEKMRAGATQDQPGPYSKIISENKTLRGPKTPS